MVSLFILALVLVFVGYFYLNASKQVAQVPSTNYSLGVLQDMQATSGNGEVNVFEKAATLSDVPQSHDATVQYSPSDLGKTDLTHPE